jgi:glycogen phosphorylase
LGISWESWLGIGRSNPGDNSEWFSMTIAALKSARYANGVSELHGQVSRKMWSHVWPDKPTNEIHIESVTNGVHPRTWIAPSIWRLYEAHVGPEIETRPAKFEAWDKVLEIPDEHLWGAHQQQRQKLVRFIRRRHSAQMTMRGESAKAIELADKVLDENALTIGFARRFATYKRGDLIFSDIKRLERILFDEQCPVQLIIAGKAHPNDKHGQAVIKRVFDFTRRNELSRRVVFLEDYDITVARYLVSGCDVWLNNPRRPEEASGTSGMKAAFNGGLNLSILDGWWAEGFSAEHGWSIGSDCNQCDPESDDELDSESLYASLQTKIVPLFYERNDSGIPLEWVEMMKRSIVNVGREFSSHRMVADYARRYYLPALRDFNALTANDCKALRRPRPAPASDYQS